MNCQLIEKVIKSSGQTCPGFTYSSPILDRNVARILSKSFVKILGLSKQNSNLNNNLRLSILENIRRICQNDPEEHIKIDENLARILLEFYNGYLKETSAQNSSDSVERKLDAFLMRRLKQININSKCNSSVNPELIQALINLNESGSCLETLSEDIIHWHMVSEKRLKILKDLWTNTYLDKTLQRCNMFDDISIKLKYEIERLILSVSQAILEQDTKIEDIFNSNSDLKNFTKKCSISAECFQICSGILNFLFIMTNFNLCMQTFISIFVKNVKEMCTEPTLSVLYPVHLKHMVILLDFDLEILPLELKKQYIQPTLRYLQSLHVDCENDLILLLSHFPQWFDIYFAENL